MTKDLRVVNIIATIVEDPDTTPMSVRLPTKEEKILPKEGIEEKNHHPEKEGVEMIVMNEDPLGEARILKGRISHQEATQKEDIKGIRLRLRQSLRKKLSLRLRIYSR